MKRLLQIAGQRKTLLLASCTLAIIHAVLSLVPYALVFYIIQFCYRSTIRNLRHCNDSREYGRFLLIGYFITYRRFQHSLRSQENDYRKGRRNAYGLSF